MENNSVTIIVPSYNRSSQLLSALNSIIAQTYKSWSAIVVIDGSKDDSLENVKKLALKDSRIQYIEHAESLGAAISRNEAMDLANSEYIAFLDDDDIWEPNKLECELNEMQNDLNCVIISSSFYCHVGDEIYLVKKENKKIKLEQLYYGNILGSFSYCMVRASALANLRIQSDLKSVQDWDLWLKILISNKHQYARTYDKILCHYYEHSSQRLSSDFRRSSRSLAKMLRVHWPKMNLKQRTMNFIRLRCKMRAYKGFSYMSVLKDLVRYFAIVQRFQKRDIGDILSPILKSSFFKQKIRRFLRI